MVSTQSENEQRPRAWRAAFLAYLEPRMLIMLALGFSAGLPFLLVGSTLSVWLRDSGIDRATVVYLTWVGLAYTFKFLWAPVVDRLRLPLIGRRFGRRRSWMLLAQAGIVAGLVLMLGAEPGQDLVRITFAALLVAVASATQDIALDAWRIEAAPPEQQGQMSASYQLGYRIAILVSGAGALYIAEYVSWTAAYTAMAVLVGVGVVATLLAPEPDAREALSVSAMLNRPEELSPRVRNRALVPVLLAWLFAGWLIANLMAHALSGGGSGGMGMALAAPLVLLAVVGVPLLTAYAIARRPGAGTAEAAPAIPLVQTALDWLYAAILAPLVDFVRRYWLLGLFILAIVLTYRLTDIVMGKVANVFYLDTGFTKEEIATVSKVYGVWITIAGAALAGVAILRYGIVRPLIAGAILGALSNLLFAWIALQPAELWALTIAITLENLAGGLAGTALIAFMSQLASQRYTATQYALFSSLYTLPGNLLGGFSGEAVDRLAAALGSDAQGYAAFFAITAVMGVPAILLCLWLLRGQVPGLAAKSAPEPSGATN